MARSSWPTTFSSADKYPFSIRPLIGCCLIHNCRISCSHKTFHISLKDGKAEDTYVCVSDRKLVVPMYIIMRVEYVCTYHEICLSVTVTLTNH